MLSLILTALAFLTGQATAAGCARELLGDVAAKFIESATTGGNTFKKASSLKYTENYKDANIAGGVFSKAIDIAHTRRLLDGPGCGIYVEIIAPNNKPGYHLATQIFVDGGGAANKVEVIITSSEPNSNSWFYNATRTLEVLQKQEASHQRDVIPEAQRVSRDHLMDVGNAYFSMFSGGPRKSISFSKGCLRQEGSRSTSQSHPLTQEGGFSRQLSCSMGATTPTRNTAPLCGTTPPIAPHTAIRGVVIDETVGTVEVFAKFMDAPDSHDFRIENCQVVLVHTVTTTVSSRAASASAAQAKMFGPKTTSAPRLK
jgi:hypothetical protein